MGLEYRQDDIFDKGNGLIGMKERLEFVNGNLEVLSENGTKVIITVPNVVKHTIEKEGKTR